MICRYYNKFITGQELPVNAWSSGAESGHDRIAREVDESITRSHERWLPEGDSSVRIPVQGQHAPVGAMLCGGFGGEHLPQVATRVRMIGGKRRKRLEFGCHRPWALFPMGSLGPSSNALVRTSVAFPDAGGGLHVDVAIRSHIRRQSDSRGLPPRLPPCGCWHVTPGQSLGAPSRSPQPEAHPRHSPDAR